MLGFASTLADDPMLLPPASVSPPWKRRCRCPGAPCSPRATSHRRQSAAPSRIPASRRRPPGTPMASPWTSMTSTVARGCHREDARAGAGVVLRPPAPRLSPRPQPYRRTAVTCTRSGNIDARWCLWHLQEIVLYYKQ